MLAIRLCSPRHNLVTPLHGLKLHLCPISFLSARFTRVMDPTHRPEATCVDPVALDRRLAQGALCAVVRDNLIDTQICFFFLSRKNALMAAK